MKFKTFISMWFLVAIIIPAVAIVVPRGQKITGSTTQHHHFSVVWKGFNPNNPIYSNQTPDYYICINDLQASVLQMSIAFEIQNNENYSFFFMIDQYQTPPTGWNITSYCIGSVPVDTSTTFTYSNLARVKPSSIPTGTMTETLALVVKAYYDSLYTQFYSQDNFTVQFHFIDRTSSVWTTLQYNNFDDGTSQGWRYGHILGSPSYPYRSYPNSYYSSRFDNTFDTRGPFTEVYLIFALDHSGIDGMNIMINGVTIFMPESGKSPTTWYQYVIPLPVSASVGVSMQGMYWGSFLDDVYVIAK